MFLLLSLLVGLIKFIQAVYADKDKLFLFCRFFFTLLLLWLRLLFLLLLLLLLRHSFFPTSPRSALPFVLATYVPSIALLCIKKNPISNPHPYALLPLLFCLTFLSGYTSFVLFFFFFCLFFFGQASFTVMVTPIYFPTPFPQISSPPNLLPILLQFNFIKFNTWPTLEKKRTK